MSILLLSNSPKVGGGNRSLLLIREGLRRQDIKSSIVVLEEGQMTDACREEKVSFVTHQFAQPSWKRPVRLWKDYRDWVQILEHSQSQLIHANDLSTARSISLAARRKKIPLICHIRFPAGEDYVEWAFRRFPKPDAFIFNSFDLQKECGSKISRFCPRSTQYVIHNAVDCEKFQPVEKQHSGTRVGILANLLPVKGHQDFLQMAQLLKTRGVDSEFWLIGEDNAQTGYRQELEKLRCELGLCDSVKFLGHRTDIPDLINELDVLVCASHVEPFGRCLIEAMACEKPVVATGVGGIPEVVVDGETGFLVPPHSPVDLADSVERLLLDSGLSKNMGKAGRTRVLSHFTPEAHTAAVIDVYESVLRGSISSDQ